ncbi:MAG: type II toxin-antitoxin system RelE/ParE family toxin [Candidatus Niyogibacteria bacterium]|nr:type II toxin-antitoxin system RelE/ParE family toxin [Candidatus Niyogibacteria bacterium]
MGVAFGIFYHELVVKKDIPKLSAVYRARIKSAIEAKLVYNPEVFGKPLRRSLHGYRKLRVGDYRVIFRTEKDKVKIFYIGHRSVAYGETQKRFR